MQRLGEGAERGRTYRRRPGAYAVLVRDGRVLLTHQAAPVPEVQLPGGGIDPGEGAVEALHREVLEETGWRIAGARRIGVYRRFTYMPDYDLWAEKLCQVWVARPVRRMGLPTEAGHTAFWAKPEAALEMLAVGGERAFWQGMLRRAIG